MVVTHSQRPFFTCWRILRIYNFHESRWLLLKPISMDIHHRKFCKTMINRQNAVIMILTKSLNNRFRFNNNDESETEIRQHIDKVVWLFHWNINSISEREIQSIIKNRNIIPLLVSQHSCEPFLWRAISGNCYAI